MRVTLNLKSGAPHGLHALQKNALGMGTAPYQNDNGCSCFICHVDNKWHQSPPNCQYSLPFQHSAILEHPTRHTNCHSLSLAVGWLSTNESNHMNPHTITYYNQSGPVPLSSQTTGTDLCALFPGQLHAPAYTLHPILS
jgi:hypothetical protein